MNGRNATGMGMGQGGGFGRGRGQGRRRAGAREDGSPCLAGPFGQRGMRAGQGPLAGEGGDIETPADAGAGPETDRPLAGMDRAGRCRRLRRRDGSCMNR